MNPTAALPRGRRRGRPARKKQSILYPIGALLIALLPPLAFVVPAHAATLTTMSWSASSAQTGATGVSYSYSLTTATTKNLSKLTMTVPAGTAGTPTVVSTLAYTNHAFTLSGPTATLAGTTLTVSFSSTNFPAGSLISVKVGALTNTSTAGSFSPVLTTFNNSSAVDAGTASPFVFSAITLSDVSWSASGNKTSAASISHSFVFTTGTASSLTRLTILLPPGTGGTPAVTSVTPSALGGGTAVRSDRTLTYTFSSQTVAAGTTIFLRIGGLTNTPAAGSYSAEIVTFNGATIVNAGVSPEVAFTTTALTGLSLSASKTQTNASDSAYTFGFTTTSSATLTSITMSLPPGTGGTPAIGSVSGTPTYLFPLAGASVSLTGALLTFSFTPKSIPVSAVFSIEITGLTNTPIAGSFASTIVTMTSTGAFEAATTPTIDLTSTVLTALSWTPSSTATGATNVTNTYNFGLSATSTISKITMSVPPGTGGMPTVGTVSPASVAGGTVTLAGQTLTYTLPTAASIDSSTTISIQIDGITNPSTASVYAASIVASNGSTVVASATTPSVFFTSGVLTALSWGSTSTATETVNATYTFGFTTNGTNMTSVTMTVPAGTGGTPALGPVTIYDPGPAQNVTVTNPSVSMSGTTITFAFDQKFFSTGTTFLISITGLTNTAAAGTYTSAITTKNGAAAVSSGTTPTLSLSATSLGSPIWNVSSTAIGVTNQSYSYSFVVATTTPVRSMTMSVPTGTTGIPSVGSVSPSSIAGGTVTLANNVLTYTFTTTTIPVNTTVAITFTGIENTSTSGTYTSTITIYDSGTAILASGVTTSVSFTSTLLTGLSWTQSVQHTGATNVTYTYTFTTASDQMLTGATMTVPNETGGAPTLGPVSATRSGNAVALTNPAVALIGTTLNLTFGSTWVLAGTAFSVQVNGMTNTPAPGDYSSAIATNNNGQTHDSGTTATTNFIGGSLGGTSWSASRTVAGTDKATHTFGFTTASRSPLSSITMTVPAGTGGVPTLGAASPAAIATGASVVLSGTTLTVSFTPAAVDSGTAISLQIDGIVNTAAVGTYRSQVTTMDGMTTIDTASSNPLAFVAPTLAIANTCAAQSVSCSVDASGATKITLLVIPGWATPSIASIALSVQTNVPNGYRLQATSSALTRIGGGANVSQGSPSGSAAMSAGFFYATATVTGTASSGASRCSPYGSAAPYVGYNTATPASIWVASAATVNGTDTGVLTNAVRVSGTQAAGTYTGTISYTVQPTLVGNSAC